MLGWLRRLLAADKEDLVSIKTPRRPTANSGFSKWAARQDQPHKVFVPLKKWPWYAKKPLETIQFKYEDRNGDYSIRTVDVFATTFTHFIGYCYSRQSSRTFKLSRIIGTITVVQGGEILHPHKWASGIYAHPRNNNEVDLGRG